MAPCSACTDAAGQTFTVSGHIGQDGQEADFWADDGHITVRRDDGAVATDTSAIGAHPIWTAPV